MVLLFIYTMVFSLLILTCYRDSAKKYHVLAKLINSSLFIVVAIYGKNVSGNSELFYSLLPALVMCLVGDVLLALFNTKKIKGLFLGGLFSFLLGHILFVVAFNKIVPLNIKDFIFPILAVFITLGLSKIKGMNLKNMKPYVVLYSFFVMMLFSKSVTVFLQEQITRNLLLSIGAFWFLISDAIIMFLYFYEKKYKLTKFFNLLTYYYAMFIIAISLLY